MLIKVNSLSDGSDILRTPTGSITANSVFIDHDGPANGTIGAGTTDTLIITADFIGAHIHGATGGGGEGIFINATDNGSGTVTVGNTCYGSASIGCDTIAGQPLAPHLILGLETVAGGEIYLTQFSGNLDIQEPIATSGGGGIQMFISGDVSLTSGLGDIDSSANVLINISGNFNNTIAAMSASGNFSISGANVFINATGITDITATGDVFLSAAGQIFNGGATGGLPDVSANNLTLFSGGGIELDFDAATLDATETTGASINLFYTSAIGTLDILSIQNDGGDISLQALSGGNLRVSGVVNGGDTVLDLISANDLIINDDVTSTSSAIISLVADSDLNGSGSLIIDNTSLDILTISSDNSLNLTGADILITGGTVAGQGVDIQSFNGDVDIDASTSDITITGGSANNTGVLIRGNQTAVTDVSVLAAGDFFLRAGTGANSSASIESTDADATGVSITATNLLIDNTGAGTDSDAFVSGSGGTTNVVITGACTGCVGVVNPAGTGGSQIGIWALNFPVGSVTNWTGGGGSDDNWTTAANWDNGVPTTGDSVFIIGAFTPGISADVGNIFSLTMDSAILRLDNATAALDLSGDLTVINDGSITLTAFGSQLSVAGNATFTGTAANVDLEVQGGIVNVTGTFNSTGIVNMNGSAVSTFGDTATFNELNISNATAVLNGINNTTNALAMSSNATLQGTGNTTTNGLFSWNESTVSHNLLVNGDMNVAFATSDAIINGGIVTLANTAVTRFISNDIDIIGTGQLINQDTLSISDSIGSLRSTDGTGILDNQATGTILFGGSGGSVDIGVSTGLQFINSGTIDAQDGLINITTTDIMQWNAGRWTANSGGISVNTTMSLNGSATKTIDGFTFTSSQPVNILGDGDLDIINSGSFTIGAGGQVTHSSNGDITSSDVSGTFINNDLFVKSAGNTEFVNIAMANNAQLDISGGSLSFSTGLANAAASVVNVSAGTLVLNEAGTPTDAGDYLVNGTGQVQVLSNRNFTGNYDFSAGSILINGAAVDFSGVPGIVDIMDLVLNGGGSISGDPLTINNTFDWIAGTVNSTTLDIQPGAVMNVSDSAAIAGDFTNNGQTNILNGGALRLIIGNTHGGVFNIATGGALDIDTGIHTFNGALGGGGTLIISTSTSDLVLQANSTVGNLQMLDGILRGNGNLDVTNLSTWSGGSMAGSGTTNFNGGVNILGPVTLDRVLNTNGGSIDGTGAVSDGVSGTAAFNLTGGLFTVVDSGNTHLVDTGITLNTGATLDVQGTLYVQLASIGVTNNGGTISGSGTIIGDVFNDGILSPGNSPGAMLIDGDLTLLSNSLLNLDVEGITSPGVDYDLLDVTGQIIFGGAMAVIIPTGSPTLKLQDNFSPVKYSSSSGQFSSITASPGYAFKPIFGPNGLVLEATSVPGLLLPRDPSTDIVNLTNNNFDLAEFFEDLSDLLIKVDADNEDEEETGTLVCS